MISFPTDKTSILALLENIDPIQYARSRNYVNGAVTYLSPYISRGVFSTRQIFEYLKNKNYTWENVEKLVQELAWRDYFQQVWNQLGEKINEDIRNPQFPILSRDLPMAFLEGNTGIEGIDSGIKNLVDYGYAHNHQRMYIASLACNVANYHWYLPAKWMYFHLLDADWASNACSWQWVAGSFSNKKYYANQENINRYCNTNQSGTYLDTTYDDLPKINVPFHLAKSRNPNFETKLPPTDKDFTIKPDLPILIYNWYNLDFDWHTELKANRVLLLEPEVFKRYPISEKGVNFMLALSKNIPNIKIFTGEFSQLRSKYPRSKFIFKQHPLNKYFGEQEDRIFLNKVNPVDTMSFFRFWKSIAGQLASEFEG
jgi:deoxyribodipyrimidine photo-lyase